MTRATRTARPPRTPARALALGVACVGAAIAGAPASGSGPAGVQDEERYIRVTDMPEDAGVALEISTRSLRHPDGGPVVHLVGVAHIAEGPFFEQIQEQLDGYDLVLYEGVGPTWYKLAPDASDEDRARVSMERIRHVGTVAEIARAADGAYPATAADLLEGANGYDRRLLAVAMLDGWLRPVRYEVGADGESIAVSSLGADGAEGGEGADKDLALGDQAAITTAELGELRGIQQMMADATGLEFQLESMDYVRSNWKNADMTIDEFMRAMDASDAMGAMEAPEVSWEDMLPEGVDPDAIGRLLGLGDEEGEGGPEGADDMAAMNNQFMEAMSGQGELMRMIEPLFEMLGDSPMMRSTIRLLMIEVLGRADELMKNDMGGMNPMSGMMEVLLDQRNDVAISELRSTIATRGDEVDSVALFYGAAHLEGMETALIDDGYEVVATTWAPAISVRYEDMGMPAAQGRMMHGMMLNLMNQMFEQMEQLGNQP